MNDTVKCRLHYYGSNILLCLFFSYFQILENSFLPNVYIATLELERSIRHLAKCLGGAINHENLNKMITLRRIQAIFLNRL